MFKGGLSPTILLISSRPDLVPKVVKKKKEAAPKKKAAPKKVGVRAVYGYRFMAGDDHPFHFDQNFRHPLLYLCQASSPKKKAAPKKKKKAPKKKQVGDLHSNVYSLPHSLALRECRLVLRAGRTQEEGA